MQTFIQVFVTEAIMMRSLLAACILAMVAPAAAFSPGCVPTLRSARAPAITMQKKVDILGKGDSPARIPCFPLCQGGASLPTEVEAPTLSSLHVCAPNLEARSLQQISKPVSFSLLLS